VVLKKRKSKNVFSDNDLRRKNSPAKFFRHEPTTALSFCGCAATRSLHRNGAKRVRVLRTLAVSGQATTLFHKLINTCVENFTQQKYFTSDSVWVVLTGARAIL
jgi:hypothetical protein